MISSFNEKYCPKMPVATIGSYFCLVYQIWAEFYECLVHCGLKEKEKEKSDRNLGLVNGKDEDEG